MGVRQKPQQVRVPAMGCNNIQDDYNLLHLNMTLAHIYPMGYRVYSIIGQQKELFVIPSSSLWLIKSSDAPSSSKFRDIISMNTSVKENVTLFLSILLYFSITARALEASVLSK